MQSIVEWSVSDFTALPLTLTENTNFKKRYGTGVQMNNYNKLQKYLENSGNVTVILYFDTLKEILGIEVNYTAALCIKIAYFPKSPAGLSQKHPLCFRYAANPAG